MAGRSLNKVMLMGHAGKDTEIAYSGAGMAIAKFSLATNDRRKDKASGEWVDHTEWHNIVAFDKLAETCNQYVKKGKQVYVEGKISTRKYEQDGQTKYFTEIIANDLILLGGQGGPNAAMSTPATSNYRAPAASNSAPEPDYEPASAPADDLPF
ncbi:MAG: single-stranded DNA-binding protein [Bacteroidota bacterium]|nr:single-stranded DNA-binding protein [Bacteroidota bacterium]MDP4231886.1 single-stranded DNA-binding protein [Bacteroidota bacterium]MDP4241407.1 single-stranded DNA-binding protein [Bacteroidota bacterium]MDP4287330.1 single-stranded DNA-binding protein [Bacteroidota bacterium]